MRLAANHATRLRDVVQQKVGRGDGPLLPALEYLEIDLGPLFFLDPSEAYYWIDVEDGAVEAHDLMKNAFHSLVPILLESSTSPKLRHLHLPFMEAHHLLKTPLAYRDEGSITSLRCYFTGTSNSGLAKLLQLPVCSHVESLHVERYAAELKYGTPVLKAFTREDINAVVEKQHVITSLSVGDGVSFPLEWLSSRLKDLRFQETDRLVIKRLAAMFQAGELPHLEVGHWSALRTGEAV